MRISIQVMKSPSFQDISSALRIAEAAINKGHEVSLILLHDAVHAIEKPPEEIQKNLKELMNRGVRVYAYGSPLESEGVSKDILLMKDSVIALNDEDSLEDLEKRVKIYALKEDVERRRIKSREGLKVELLPRKKLYDLVKKFDFVVFV